MTLGVVFRFSGASLVWYDEVASILLAWLTFYGSALASVKRAHIGCPGLVERLPWRARRAVSIAAQLLVIAFFALLGRRRRLDRSGAGHRRDGEPPVDSDERRAVGDSDQRALIIIAELMHLIDLVTVRGPPPRRGAGATLAEGTQ